MVREEERWDGSTRASLFEEMVNLPRPGVFERRFSDSPARFAANNFANPAVLLMSAFDIVPSRSFLGQIEGSDTPVESKLTTRPKRDLRRLRLIAVINGWLLLPVCQTLPMSARRCLWSFAATHGCLPLPMEFCLLELLKCREP